MKNEKIIHALCTLPSNDGNFHSALKSATDEELTQALVLMESSPEGNLTRILGVKYEIKARTKAKNEAEAEKNSPQMSMESFLEAQEKADSIISFPSTESIEDKVEVTETADVNTTTTVENSVENVTDKVNDSTPTDTIETPAEVKDSVSDTEIPKPIEENKGDAKVEEKKESTKVVEPELTPFEAAIQDYCNTIEVTKSNTVYTAKDVFDKLSKEKPLFPDRDSHFIINQLADKSVNDQNLCNAIMQEHKSYKKAFAYFKDLAKQGKAGHKIEEGEVYLDREEALDLAIDYFFLDEAKVEAERKAKEEEKKKKAEEEKKRKAEEKKAAKKTTTRKPRKKKGETEEVAATPADTSTSDTSIDTPSAEVSVEAQSDVNEGVVDTVITEPTPEVSTVVEKIVAESDTTGVTEDNNGSTTEESTKVTTEVEPVQDGSFEVKDSVIMDSPRPIEEPVEEPVEEPSGQLSFTFI